MARRPQAALVRGRRSACWIYRDDCLVLRAHDGLAEVIVPVGDLLDEARMRTHRARIRPFAPDGAERELDEIVAGTRPR